MTATAEDIYRSQNGDVWRLMRDTASGRLYVRHQANASSGGHVTDRDVEEFLGQGGSGPEYVALRRLMAASADAGLHDRVFRREPAEAKSSLAKGEVLVGHFPPGDYRLEAGPDGVRLIRLDKAEPAPTVDPAAATPASISLKNWNRRLWNRRSNDL